VIVAVNVALAVGAPVMVAALGNGNNIVKVFDAVRRSGVDELREQQQHASDIGRHRCSLRARLRALITATASFPLPSAATTPGATTATVRSTPTVTQWPRRFTPQVLIGRS
jgi:hypothetical protein